MKIAFELPIGTDVQRLARDLDQVREMHRKRYARLKEFAMKAGGPQQKEALKEMETMTRSFPSFSTLVDRINEIAKEHGEQISEFTEAVEKATEAA